MTLEFITNMPKEGPIETAAKTGNLLGIEAERASPLTRD
jgi:hypothetical protein